MEYLKNICASIKNIVLTIIRHLKLLWFFIRNRLPIKGYYNCVRNHIREGFMWFVMLHMLNDSWMFWVWLTLTWISFNFIFEEHEVKYIRKTLMDMAYGRGGFKKYGRDEKLIRLMKQAKREVDYEWRTF